jgi:hypothetical protein
VSIVPGRDVPAVPDEWVDAVNKRINDENHDDLCACDGWPDACGHYKPGQWDLGVSLDIAVGVLEPLIRDRVAAEIGEADRLKARIAVLEADREELAAEKERFRRIIAIADDGCTCMAVTAARAKVRNEEDAEAGDA